MVKRKYKRKVTRKRTYTKLSNDDATKQLAVLKYPHSKATLIPKIPDGSSVQSIGSQFHDVIQMAPRANDTFYIVLYPGLMGSCAVYEQFDVNTGSPQEVPFVTTKTNVVSFITEPTPLAAGATEIKFRQETLAKWRVVASGLRISITNNDDNNDGTWEAIRTQINSATTGSRVILTNDVITNWLFDPTPLIKNHTWANSPTYTTGLLKDLHKHYFQLAQTNPDHDYTRIGRNHVIGVVEETPNTQYKLNTTNGISNATNDQFVDEMVDKNMDAIIIRIQGKINITSLLFDVAHNLEYEVNPTSPVTQFLSETSNAGAALTRCKEQLRRKLISA